MNNQFGMEGVFPYFCSPDWDSPTIPKRPTRPFPFSPLSTKTQKAATQTLACPVPQISAASEGHASSLEQRGEQGRAKERWGGRTR